MEANFHSSSIRRFSNNTSEDPDRSDYLSLVARLSTSKRLGTLSTYPKVVGGFRNRFEGTMIAETNEQTNDRFVSQRDGAPLIRTWQNFTLTIVIPAESVDDDNASCVPFFQVGYNV